MLSILELEANRFVSLATLQDQMKQKQLGRGGRFDPVYELLQAAVWARHIFGIDALEGVDRANPVFHSDFDWRRFDHGIPGDPLTEEELGAII